MTIPKGAHVAAIWVLKSKAQKLMLVLWHLKGFWWTNLDDGSDEEDVADIGRVTELEARADVREILCLDRAVKSVAVTQIEVNSTTWDAAMAEAERL